jgi:hypothetical protein
MKKLFVTLIIAAIIFISSCTNHSPENYGGRKIQPFNNIKKEKEEGTIGDPPVFGDEPKEKNPFDMYYCYPLSSVYIFENPVENVFFDAVWKKYKTDPDSKVKQEREICLGDYCQSYEILTNIKNKLKIFFFKGEAGEYGFDNSQYVFRNDSLIFSRSFNVDILEWSTDSSSTSWQITECIGKLDSGHVTKIEKKTVSSDLEIFDYSMENIRGKKTEPKYHIWLREIKSEIGYGINLATKAKKYN